MKSGIADAIHNVSNRGSHKLKKCKVLFNSEKSQELEEIARSDKRSCNFCDELCQKLERNWCG